MKDKKKYAILNFNKLFDERGNLTFLESENQIPFKIKRVYWIYDVPGGEVRGGHGYKKLEEVIIALSGSFDVELSFGGTKKKTINLNRSYKGLYIPGMTWRQLKQFSTNSVALILASSPYDPEDYIYDFKEFEKLKNV